MVKKKNKNNPLESMRMLSVMISDFPAFKKYESGYSFFCPLSSNTQIAGTTNWKRDLRLTPNKLTAETMTKAMRLIRIAYSTEDAPSSLKYKPEHICFIFFIRAKLAHEECLIPFF